MMLSEEIINVTRGKRTLLYRPLSHASVSVGVVRSEAHQ